MFVGGRTPKWKATAENTGHWSFPRCFEREFQGGGSLGPSGVPEQDVDALGATARVNRKEERVDEAIDSKSGVFSFPITDSR